jgi:hypothetical protein
MSTWHGENFLAAVSFSLPSSSMAKYGGAQHSTAQAQAQHILSLSTHITGGLPPRQAGMQAGRKARWAAWLALHDTTRILFSLFFCVLLPLRQSIGADLVVVLVFSFVFVLVFFSSLLYVFLLSTSKFRRRSKSFINFKTLDNGNRTQRK